MASQTTNLHLKKPALDDDALITDINNNMDLIDTFAGTTDTKLGRLDPTNTAWLTNVDANNYKTTGTYPMSTGCSNLPGTWGILCVSAPRSDILYQTFANDGGFFWREYNSSVSPNWKSWRKLNDESYIAIVTNGNTAPIAISQGKYVIWNAGLYVAKAPISSGATLSTSNLDAVAEGGLNALRTLYSSNTYTTDSAGYALISGSKLYIISAISAGYMCIPFYHTNNSTYVKVLNFSTLQPVASASVTIELKYYTT